MPNNTETSKNSTRQLTLDELIYSQEGSPASPTLSPESERERMTSATYGQRCCALFENAPRATSWARTFAALLVGMEGWYSKRCALTWKLVGTPYNRLYFQLQVSVLPTEETEFGLLLTPTTREEVMDTDKFKERMEKYDNGTTVPNLATQVMGLLPTPQANCSKGMNPQNVEARGSKLYNKKTGNQIQSSPEQWAKMGMLPTPVANDDNKTPEAHLAMKARMKGGARKKITSLQVAMKAATGTRSQLSPLFVEEMMGFPKNWTASPFQSGEKNP